MRPSMPERYGVTWPPTCATFDARLGTTTPNARSNATNVPAPIAAMAPSREKPRAWRRETTGSAR